MPKLLLLAVALTAIPAGVLVLRGTSSSDSAESSQILYLTADLATLPASALELEAAGVRVVHSDEELKEAFSAATRVVIIDESIAAEVDRAWLSARHREGLLVVGMNLDMYALWDLVAYEMPLMPDGTRAEAGPWLRSGEWQGHAFYTYHRILRGDTGGLSHGGGQAVLQDFPEFIATLSEVCGRTKLADGSEERYCYPGTPPDPFWWREVLREDREKPRVDTTINGIRIGPVADASISRTECRNDAAEDDVRTQSYPVDRASGTSLEIRPGYLPQGTTLVTASAIGCDRFGIGFVEHLYNVPADVPTLRYGGILEIFRLTGEHALSLDAPADRTEAGTIARRPAVIVTPVTPEGFGSSAVVIADSFGLTVVKAEGLRLEEIVSIAEGLY